MLPERSKLIIVEGESGTGRTHLAQSCAYDGIDDESRLTLEYFQVTLHDVLRAKSIGQWLADVDKRMTNQADATFAVVVDDVDYLNVKSKNLQAPITCFFDILTLLCHKWRTLNNVHAIILVMSEGITAFKQFPSMCHPFWGSATSKRTPVLNNQMRFELLSTMVGNLNPSSLARLSDFADAPGTLTGLTCKDLLSLAHLIVNERAPMTVSQPFAAASYRKHSFNVTDAADILEEESLVPLGGQRGKDAIVGRDKEFDTLYEICRPRTPQSRPIGVIMTGTGARTVVLRVAESLSRPVLLLAAADIFGSLVGASERKLYELSKLVIDRPDLIVICQNLDDWFGSETKSSRRLIKGLGDLFTYCEYNILPETLDTQPVIIATTERSTQLPQELVKPHLFSYHLELQPLEELFTQDNGVLLSFLHLYLEGRASPDIDHVQICDALLSSKNSIAPSNLIHIMQEAALQEIALCIGTQLMSETLSRPKISISTRAILEIIRKRQST